MAHPALLILGDGEPFAQGAVRIFGDLGIHRDRHVADEAAEQFLAHPFPPFDRIGGGVVGECGQPRRMSEDPGSVLHLERLVRRIRPLEVVDVVHPDRVLRRFVVVRGINFPGALVLCPILSEIEFGALQGAHQDAPDVAILAEESLFQIEFGLFEVHFRDLGGGLFALHAAGALVHFAEGREVLGRLLRLLLHLRVVAAVLDVEAVRRQQGPEDVLVVCEHPFHQAVGLCRELSGDAVDVFCRDHPVGIVGTAEPLLVLENVVDALVAEVVLEKAQDAGLFDRAVRQDAAHLALVVLAGFEFPGLGGLDERLVRDAVGEGVGDGVARLARGEFRPAVLVGFAAAEFIPI